MMREWTDLAQFLIVKYNDNVVKPEKNGRFVVTPEGLGAPVKSVGYPDAVRQRIVEETGTRFLVPEKEK